MKQAPATTVFVVVETANGEGDVTIYTSFEAALRHVRRSTILYNIASGKTGKESETAATRIQDGLTSRVMELDDDWATVWTEDSGLRFEIHQAAIRLPGPVVPTGDLWVMLMSTIRYAMGKTSYLAGLTTDLVRTFRPWLRPIEAEQIRDEVQQGVAQAERHGRLLGDQTNHNLWKQLVQDLTT